jgi:hypothetical protein
MGMATRGTRLAQLGSAAVLAVAVLAGTASGRSAAVGLAVAGNVSADVTVAQGRTVSLVSRAALRTGDRLVIVVKRGSERRLRSVAACPRSPCRGRWTEKSAISDRFQALVRRGAGASAPIGQSRLVRVTWKAPPPPPPPATPGHYAGRSTFNETFDFDVSADGKSVVNLRTGQINESCNPRANISGGNLSAPGPYPIAADGSFSINATITIAIGSAAGSRKIAITGRLTGATATGTIRTDTTFTQAGTNFACNSGDQTWSATKV